MGRKHERIPIFLKLVDWLKLIEELSLAAGTKFSSAMLSNSILNNIITITYEWTRNPDLRIGQLLINLGIVPDNLVLYNLECNAILKAQKVDKRKYILWGTFGKEGDYPEAKHIPVCDLQTEHIKSILRTQVLSKKLKKLLRKELKLRKK